MTNPITQAFRDADPDYVPNKRQQRAIDNPDDQNDSAEHIARGVPKQIESYRAVLAANLGIDKEQILPGDVMDKVSVHFESHGYGRYPDGTLPDVNFFRKLSVDKAYEIGHRLGHQPADPVTTLYREVLGREPDESGLAYWQDVYDDGARLSDIVRAFEDSDEAQQ